MTMLRFRTTLNPRSGSNLLRSSKREYLKWQLHVKLKEASQPVQTFIKDFEFQVAGLLMAVVFLIPYNIATILFCFRMFCLSWCVMMLGLLSAKEFL